MSDNKKILDQVKNVVLSKKSNECLHLSVECHYSLGQPKISTICKTNPRIFGNGVQYKLKHCSTRFYPLLYGRISLICKSLKLYSYEVLT